MGFAGSLLDDFDEVHFGLPIFKSDDIINHKEQLYIYNDNMNIELFIGNHHIRVSLTKNISINYINNKNIAFGFDLDGYISDIIIDHIVHDDMVLIKEYLTY